MKFLGAKKHGKWLTSESLTEGGHDPNWTNKDNIENGLVGNGFSHELLKYAVRLLVYSCDKCGHVQHFNIGGNKSSSWKNRTSRHPQN